MTTITYRDYTIETKSNEVVITQGDEEFIGRLPADEEKLLTFARRKIDSYISQNRINGTNHKGVQNGKFSH